jgi:uncharacterized membrane protein YidH (DUF202 family)
MHVMIMQGLYIAKPALYNWRQYMSERREKYMRKYCHIPLVFSYISTEVHDYNLKI